MDSNIISQRVQDTYVLPKIETNIKSSDNNLNCVLSYLETNLNFSKNELNTSRFNGCIPDDLLVSLKQTEQPKEYLGPIRRNTLNNQPLNRKPDNVWNNVKMREKLRFLTDQPVCSCGAGKDISFLFDAMMNQEAPPPKPKSKHDLSAIRAPEETNEIPVKLPDSLVPDEYHIVKSRGVWPLKIQENKFTTMPEQHLEHVTIFPSMKPTSRKEVLQLKHTMDALLQKVGLDTIEQKGPTQLHNLLELIKQEQDIYNIIFNEVIRQVTVECKERGEILSNLRERYANLLSKVPRQIKSLHEEVIAQRALDRRLTEELINFKATIAYLTEELSEVREHDRKISDEAHNSQNDLETALHEAQKNASLLSEYHDLYELQRKRLEKLVQTLVEERELWCNAAYGIAMKITEENRLNTSKRLNIAEKSWYKSAHHFTIFLSDKDTKSIAEIQKNAESWREIIQEYNSDLNSQEDETRKNFQRIFGSLQQTKNFFQTNSLDSENKFVNPPDNRKVSQILNDIRYWQELLAKENEKYNGDIVLIADERLKKAERFLQKWMELISKIIQRHLVPKDEEMAKDYSSHDELNTKIIKLHEQYHIRSHGDNGTAKIVLNLNNGLDVWNVKLHSFITQKDSKAPIKIFDNEWIAFYQSLDEWIELIKKGLQYVGMATKESEDNQTPKTPSIIISHTSLLNEIHQWLSSLSHHIESQDACMVDDVDKIHSEMIHWMIQMLIRLAPDGDLSEEALKIIYTSSASVERLIEIARQLVIKIEAFTQSIVFCCESIATEDFLEKQNQNVEKPDKELQNLKNLQAECREWILSVKLLIGELSADAVDEEGVQTNDGMTTDFADTTMNEATTEKAITRTATVKSDRTIYKELNRYESEKLKQDSNVYEALADDQNTVKVPLENIKAEFAQDSVYKAFTTIERLQNELIHTEERAQVAEARIANLELSLKTALEKIRKLENNKQIDYDKLDKKIPEINVDTNEFKSTIDDLDSASKQKPKQKPFSNQPVKRTKK